MNIGYTVHSLARLRERGISKKEVREAVRAGKKTDAAGDSRMAALRNKNGTLVVIYNAKGPDKIEVITAYRQ